MREALEHLASSDLRNVIIAVDFDGTCVTHEFPAVGADVPHAADVLQALAHGGAKLILWTMRSDAEFDGTGGPNSVEAREYLSDASAWFRQRGITLHSLNNNPQQIQWTSSPKCYAHIYIDDAALGCPLIENDHARPYVDWKKVAEMLANRF